jgi:hypothetical protein
LKWRWSLVDKDISSLSLILAVTGQFRIHRLFFASVAYVLWLLISLFLLDSLCIRVVFKDARVSVSFQT